MKIHGSLILIKVHPDILERIQYSHEQYGQIDSGLTPDGTVRTMRKLPSAPSAINTFDELKEGLDPKSDHRACQLFRVLCQVAHREIRDTSCCPCPLDWHCQQRC